MTIPKIHSNSKNISSRTIKSESSIRVNRSQRGLGDNTSRKVGLLDVILGSGRHLQHTVESELRFRYFHTKGFLGREKCLFKGILCLQVLQFFGDSRVGPSLRKAQLFAQSDLLHPTSSQLLKELGLFLQYLHLLLFYLLDVATQGVTSITELHPLRIR
jgi:hypothetical protein